MRPSPLQSLDVVGLDFETYHDDKYSLRRQDMSTSLYVRDERFEPHVVGLQKETWSRPRWFSGNQIGRELRKFDWSRTAVLAHHNHFDGLILNHHYGITPKYYCCTLSMGRALHGNSIPGDLDSVAQHWGYRGKTQGVLDQVKGKHLGDIPKALLQTYGDYCANDVDIMMKVFFDMLDEGYPDDELDLIDLTVSMFTEPVLQVNRKLAQAEYDREREKRIALFLAAAKATPTTQQVFAKTNFDPGAPLNDREEQLKPLAKLFNSKEGYAQYLRDLGIDPPQKFKRTPTVPEGRWIYAFAKTDLEFQNLKAHEDERVRHAIEAREVASSSINITRAMGLLRRSENNMALPVYLNYCGAHTMRWSGGDKVNPQNFPDPKKGLDSRLRECLMAPKNMLLGVVDSSQIEARKVNWLAEQWDKLEIFADPKRDPYCEFAGKLYNRKITKQDATERFVGKVCVLGLGYQMGATKLQMTLALGLMGPPVFLELDQCQKAVDIFRNEHHKIRLLWRQMQAYIDACLFRGQEVTVRDVLHFRKGAIGVPNGLELLYPNLRPEQVYDEERDWERVEFRYRQRGNDWSKIYGGLLTENIVQNLSRIGVGEQALEVSKHYRVVSLAHDEIVFLMPERWKKRALGEVIEIMSTPPTWAPDIPLEAEGHYSKYYLKP